MTTSTDDLNKDKGPMIRVTSCTDPLMWYISHIGKEYPYKGQYEDAYRVIDEQGFINTVKFENAVFVEPATSPVPEAEPQTSPNPEPPVGIENKHAGMVTDLMKSGEKILAHTTPRRMALLHAAVGIAGEAGEVLDILKKHVMNDKRLSIPDLKKEMGDVEFYMEALRQELQISREEVLEGNYMKLAVRYPAGTYSDKAAHAQADKMEDEAGEVCFYCKKSAIKVDVVKPGKEDKYIITHPDGQVYQYGAIELLKHYDKAIRPGLRSKVF